VSDELDQPTNALVLETRSGDLRPTVELLREVPEEEVWLQGQRSGQTRRAYKADIRHFIEALGVRSREELRRVDRAAVIHWQRAMEAEGARPRTIRRRLSALSSLFSHLVTRRLADTNPCREVKRPRVNRTRGETRSFSQKQARALLDAPDVTTLQGLRDRVILSIGLQVGARRSEIARLAVKDFHQNQGYWSLHFVRKGGEDLSVSVNPQTAQRIHEYLRAAGHGTDLDGPLLRPTRSNGRSNDGRRRMSADMVDRVLKKYCRQVDLPLGFSAHSMRATFITTALQNGASLEDVQRDVGHADPTTTKLYDRRGHNTYLEGTYSEIYPDISQDEAGLQKLFLQFSFPGGIPSHASPECPGSIHEGGELGYSLSHSFGAVFDNPDLVVACVVGDGEAETGPLATAWHSNKFLNPATDGAVLPILHLNGYKIANPTLLARITREELEQLFRGYGWTPLFVEGDEPELMHETMAGALDTAIEHIKAIRADARGHGNLSRPRWPMIILNSPKGWTGPKVVDGLQVEGTFRAHQVPLHPRAHPEHLELLDAWLRSYRPEELFDERGRLKPELAELAPKGERRMGKNPHANGGVLLQDLRMPDFREYAADVPTPGKRGIGDGCSVQDLDVVLAAWPLSGDLPVDLPQTDDVLAVGRERALGR